MSKNRLIERVVTFLIKLTEGDVDAVIYDRGSGICTNLTRYVSREMMGDYGMFYICRRCGARYREICESYPEYSGEILYPLPGGEALYINTPDKYLGENLFDRQKFACHILNYVNQKSIA